jgi:hypothetical protein
MLERSPDLGQRENRIPIPTHAFLTSETLDVNGVKIQLDYKGVNHTPGNIFIYTPKQKVLAAIDIISRGWSVFRHCDASENIRGGVEAHDWILEYDFTARVAGHVNRWGTRVDAVEPHEYITDLVNYSKEAVEQIDDTDLINRQGLGNAWVLWENWMNELSNYATKMTLEKKTSTGQTWPERLAGNDVMTTYRAYLIVGALRLEWGFMSVMSVLEQ